MSVCSSLLVDLVVVLGLAESLHCCEVLDRSLDAIVVEDLLELLALRLRHLELLVHRILKRLLLGIADVDRLV